MTPKIVGFKMDVEMYNKCNNQIYFVTKITKIRFDSTCTISLHQFG